MLTSLPEGRDGIRHSTRSPEQKQGHRDHKAPAEESCMNTFHFWIAPLLINSSFFPFSPFCRFHDPSPCAGSKQDIFSHGYANRSTETLTVEMGSRLLTLGWGLFAMLIGVAIVARIRTWLRLRHIPGPPFAGFSELWLLRKTLAGRCHLDTAEACSKYGAKSNSRRSSGDADCYSRLYCPNWPEPARYQ